MARKIYRIEPTDDSRVMIGITDDGETLRVYRGAFFQNRGKDEASYVLPCLWEGPIADWTTEVQEAVQRGETVKPTVKKIIRRRGAK